MIVCICNALREKEIAREAVRGATDASQVFASLGCEQRCGTCVPEIQTLLGQPAERTFPCERLPLSSNNSMGCSTTN